jgi:hypothetical protein
MSKSFVSCKYVSFLGLGMFYQFILGHLVLKDIVSLCSLRNLVVMRWCRFQNVSVEGV